MVSHRGDKSNSNTAVRFAIQVEIGLFFRVAINVSSSVATKPEEPNMESVFEMEESVTVSI